MKKHFFFIKRFVEPVQPGVGSSGAAEMPKSPNVGGHIVSKVLFTSPSSTPNLDRSHDTHRYTSTHRLESRYGDTDDDDDVVDMVDMVAFPRARRVTRTGTLPCTFLVDDNGLHLKQ
jgi:hypothetical protein